MTRWQPILTVTSPEKVDKLRHITVYYTGTGTPVIRQRLLSPSIKGPLFSCLGYRCMYRYLCRVVSRTVYSTVRRLAQVSVVCFTGPDTSLVNCPKLYYKCNVNGTVQCSAVQHSAVYCRYVLEQLTSSSCTCCILYLKYSTLHWCQCALTTCSFCLCLVSFKAFFHHRLQGHGTLYCITV